MDTADAPAVASGSPRGPGDIPPRYRVATYPDASQLARLREARMTPAPAAAGTAPARGAAIAPAPARPRRAPRPRPEIRIASLVVALASLALAGFAARDVREIQDATLSAVAWFGVAFFALIGALSARAFYLGLFPPGR